MHGTTTTATLVRRISRGWWTTSMRCSRRPFTSPSPTISTRSAYARSFSTQSSTPFATMDALSKPTWLDDGLKFGCTVCGKCCKGKTTNVYVNEVETKMLASLLEVNFENFSTEYTEKRKLSSGETVTSLKNKEGACILFDKKQNKCSVYEARPLKCRTYPFWKSTLVGKAEWDAESTRCEGINRKDAPLIKKDEIVENLILSEIHAKGSGPNWDFNQAKELLVHKEEIESWTESFFDMHYSKTLYEDSLLRVVESTVPTFVPDEGEEDNESDATEDSGENKIATFETTRRLEFVNSSLYSQTEMAVLDNTNDRNNLSDESIRRVDHSTLLMSSHRVMAGVCELALGFDNPVGRKRVAVIGAGGCAIPSYFISLVKQYLPLNQQDFLQIAAVEPEKSVLKVAQEYFDADLDSPQLKAFAMDGKKFLITNRDNINAEGENDNLSKHYINALFDIIIVDAYESSIRKGDSDEDEVHTAPPASLLEDRTLFLTSLRPGGILIVNIHGDDKWREQVRLHFVNEMFMEEPIILAVKAEESSNSMMSAAGTNCILLTAAKADSHHLVSVIRELMAARTKPPSFSDSQ